ncbi:MAG: SGNH/GDSL hydrolase family protein [Candidatus Latescibacteria bacterium]|nr:SGNH/GDSL hydrolase family protein [Candidatus Latescibacterota bacterium]
MKKVYVIGDSISIQYGPYLQQALRGVMEYGRKEGEEEALLNLDQPQGANGGDSSMVLDFLRAKARTGGIAADVLLLNCGLHDLRTTPATGEKQVPLPRYRENLAAIINLVAQLEPSLVWMRTTPCDERVHNSRPEIAFHRFAADGAAYNQAADEVMRAHGVPILDLYTFTVNLGEDLYCDHVHFHEAIRAQQAAFLAGWLAAWSGRP